MEKVTSTAAKPGTTTAMTRRLLACGLVAGPLYLIVGLVQAFTRPGFDITRHSLSLLSNGDLGWIHITNLVVSGLLVMAGAVGMRQALFDGRGKVWGPVLVGVYGLGLIGSGFFVANPAFGFPPGTPADANAVSGQGLMHFVSGGVGFSRSLPPVWCLLAALLPPGRGGGRCSLLLPGSSSWQDSPESPRDRAVVGASLAFGLGWCLPGPGSRRCRQGCEVGLPA